MQRFQHRFPHLIPPRLQQALRLLPHTCWESSRPMGVTGGPVHDEAISLTQAQAEVYEPVARGDHFGGNPISWKQRWLRFDLPAATEGERGRRHLIWDCDGESTLWCDGRPWAGIDVAHLHCPLPDAAQTVWIEVNTYSTGMYAGNSLKPGREGAVFRAALLVVRDGTAWRRRQDLEAYSALLDHHLEAIGYRAPRDGRVTPLERMPVSLRKLLDDLDRCCQAIEAGDLLALDAHLARLNQRLLRTPWAEASEGRIALVGHSHLDVVWWWPEKVTRRKAVHTAASMLRRLEADPAFRFTQSQPHLYRIIEAASPALAQEIRRAIARGRWECTGAFYVEPDLNLPCGEALARSLLFGQQEISRWTGAPATVAWLPDTFGFPACLPQMLAQAGVTALFTAKVAWSAVNRFPHNSFRWRGCDGTEVLTHLSRHGYAGQVALAELTGAVEENPQAAICDEVLVPTGHGDGAGGVTELMCERAARLGAWTGLPALRWRQAQEYFTDLARVADDLPVHQGELYLELHRGVWTTHAGFKKLYRACERALLDHETVHAAGGGPALGLADWERVLVAQFHDALPGTSMDQVYADLRQELGSVLAQHTQSARSFGAQRQEAAALHVFDTTLVPRTALIELADTPLAGVAAVKVQGSAYPVQTLGDGRQVAALPLLAGATTVVQAAPAASVKPLSAGPDHLRSDRVSAHFDDQGRLTGLVIDGQTQSVCADGLFLSTDRPANWDAWDIDWPTTVNASALPGSPLRVADGGPVLAVVERQMRLGQASTLTLRYQVVAGQACLHIEALVDWQEEHRLLRYRLATGYRGRNARFGLPYGAVDRSQQPGTEVDDARWVVPGHRWAAVRDDGGQGLAIVTEASQGWICRDGILELLLLRAPTSPDPQPDRGQHRIRFALAPYLAHSAEDRQSTGVLAETLYRDPVPCSGETLALPWKIADLGGLVPSGCAPAQDGDGVILRLHDASGSAGQAHLNLNRPLRVQPVDLLERPLGAALIERDGLVTLTYRPFQILGLRLSEK